MAQVFGSWLSQSSSNHCGHLRSKTSNGRALSISFSNSALKINKNRSIFLKKKDTFCFMNRCNPRYGKVPMSFRFSSILHKISDCVHFVSSIKGCEQDSSLGEGSCSSSLSVHRNTSCVFSLDPHDRLMPPASLCLQTLYIVLANTLNSILTQLSIKYF